MSAVSRRELLTGAGLVIAFHFVPRASRVAQRRRKTRNRPAPSRRRRLRRTPFLRIAPDDTVTVILAHSEMGQGIWTGLAMVIAEELGCDWKKIRSEHAPAAIVYGHPKMGIQMTGGSSTTNGEFDRYRTVGAMAKEMLVRAAAAKWVVAPSDCKVEKRHHHEQEGQGRLRQAHLRRDRGRGDEADAAGGGEAEGPLRVDDHRQADEAARLAREDHGQGDLRVWMCSSPGFAPPSSRGRPSSARRW